MIEKFKTLFVVKSSLISLYLIFFKIIGLSNVNTRVNFFPSVDRGPLSLEDESRAAEAALSMPLGHVPLQVTVGREDKNSSLSDFPPMKI